jgi:hypothetical protein
VIFNPFNPLTCAIVNVHQLINSTVIDTSDAKQSLRAKIGAERFEEVSMLIRPATGFETGKSMSR